MRILPMAVALIGLSTAGALAAPPPQNAKPLSEILRSVEQSPDFGYVDEVDWDHGSYQIEYYTKAGAKMELHVDPVTGKKRQ